jgi:2-keto-4-pentenoate hydratase/2-oxohepta-3-ene-1,7-dioic acid hydratase in catechol pathway
MKIGYVSGRNNVRRWAILDHDRNVARGIAGSICDWAPRLAADGQGSLPLDGDTVPLSELRLLAPVDPQARVFGVGINYLKHITRLGRKEPPPHTIGYIKPNSAVVDPDGVIQYPATTRQFDFEIELVAVVGRPLRDAPSATSCLLGYTVGNDISARDAGKGLGVLDLFSQKGLDQTAPIGPWIVTLDELGGAGQPELNLTMRVNGELRQEDNTRNMIFSVDELLDFVDARVVLKPGDLLFTGTTCGVGLEDGRFLQPGDKLETAIEGIGTLRNTIGEKRVLSPARRAGRLGLPAE